MLGRHRSLFRVSEDIAYFNVARMGLRLRSVEDAAAWTSAWTGQPWTVDDEAFFTLPDLFRQRAGAVMGADPDAVAIVPSASYGLTAAARNLSVAPGQEILVLDGQFPSNVYVWRDLAAESGADVRTLRRAPEDRWTTVILDALNDRTAILACPQVHWLDGGVIDIAAVTAKARAHGAAVALDLTQSIGAMPMALSQVDPDFAVAALYKWGLGPYATAALYVSPRHWRGRALEAGWITRAGAEDFAHLTDYRDAQHETARRFDMGERAQFYLLPLANAALKQLADWTPQGVSDELGALNRRLAEELAGLSLSCEPEDRRAPHYLGVTLPKGAPPDLTQRLAAQGVHVSQRKDRLRVTGHLHVHERDVSRLLDGLREHLG